MSIGNVKLKPQQQGEVRTPPKWKPSPFSSDSLMPQAVFETAKVTWRWVDPTRLENASWWEGEQWTGVAKDLS